MREAGVPVVLLSGMAADERLFAAQMAAFPRLRVQLWIEPLAGESVRSYAARLAPLADPECRASSAGRRSAASWRWRWRGTCRPWRAC